MLMTFTLNAQPEKLLEISAESFHPVQTDAISGVPIDKIGKDPSKRPCARIKMHINRMTRDEIEGVSVRPIGGSVVVTKRTLSAEGNGLVIELTAKEPTRFYLHHPKYGDSNEVSLNLEGNKEYRIDARLNTTYSIVVSSNKPESEVYLDGTYKGQISNKYDLTISDVYPGPHRIKVISGSVSEEQSVEVNSSNIHFRIILNLESAAPQYVAFMVNPKDANLIIDNRPYMLNKYGEMTEPLMLNNGTYTYAVFAKDYHEERGTFTVSGAKVEKHVNLRPAYGLLKVSGNGNLNGASIYVDDKLIGQAPITSGRLSSGEHTIRISQQLYKDYIGKIYIYDEKTTECNPELTADFATVTLSSEAGSEIYVNGNLKGKSPWTGNLRSGVYNFEARLTGHSNSTISKTISAVPSVQSYAIPSPTPILEKVDFISSPMADVYIDGKHIGRTPLSMNLIIGKHTVSFKKDGFQTQDRSFEVKDGIPSTVKVTLNEVSATSSKPITGAFKDITIEHNVMKDGVKGMKILVDFEVQNMKDISGSCDAYFYYKDGTRVKGKTSKFQTKTGNATAIRDIKPKYDNSTFTDLEIFMPYSELDVSSGKHELKFHCTLWEHKESWKEVATSRWYNFTFRR